MGIKLYISEDSLFNFFGIIDLVIGVSAFVVRLYDDHNFEKFDEKSAEAYL